VFIYFTAYASDVLQALELLLILRTIQFATIALLPTLWIVAYKSIQKYVH